MERVRLQIRGVVQGVGFRPYVHRLASDTRLCGWIRNSAQGVTIEVEGPREQIESFLRRLPAERPPHSFIQSMETTWLDPAGYREFEILPSQESGSITALVMPDVATCADCLRELFDPADRRYLYPFINCTHCGPRYTIITALPYDRSNTTMARFVMCESCRREYDDPSNRRFHAQPNACPACGPQLELWDAQGRRVLGPPVDRNVQTSSAPQHITRAILQRAAQALREGAVLALKGLGGFHLVVLARLDGAVQRLRGRKHREAKPLALMFPDLGSVRRVCEVTEAEARVLTGPASPIVLLRKRDVPAPDAPPISEAVAPGNPYLGIMLPYTPLHHLLLAEVGEPVVATSGNLSEEPICIDEREALERLGGIADLFLVHNRPIARHVDDSVVRVVEGREMLLRRARGYAPLPLRLHGFPDRWCNPDFVVLAAGAHLKNAVGLAVGDQVFLSQHIGDLDTEAAQRAWARVARDLPELYRVQPRVVLTDLHPDYASTRLARRLITEQRSSTSAPSPIAHRAVQHHLAHALAVMVENEVSPPALGVSWDGTGLGWDGTIWGCEFFRIESQAAFRIATLRPFRLPGGDVAARETRRAALGLLHELARANPEWGPWLTELSRQWFGPQELRVLLQMLDRGVNAPWCSSAGRLFDAVACLLGLRRVNLFEAQAAMELEFLVNEGAPWQPYPVTLAPSGKAGANPGASSKNTTEPQLLLDWAPTILSLLEDMRLGADRSGMATRFHQTMVCALVEVARRERLRSVLLGGGCFQNRWLLEWTVQRLRQAGCQPYWAQRVPPNDGAIAVGQVAAMVAGLDESVRSEAVALGGAGAVHGI